MFTQDETSNALATARTQLAPDPRATRVVSGELHLKSLQSSLRTVDRDSGILLAPHRTKGVAWIIPDRPVSMPSVQLAAVSVTHSHNHLTVPTLGELVHCRGSCLHPGQQQGLL